MMKRFSPFSFPAASLALLVLAQFLFVGVYLASERAFPFWDYAMYANMAIDWFSMEDHAAFIDRFYESFKQNYNLLFALPSLVSFSFFEPSRPLFIKTNFIVFFLAHELALAWTLRRIFDFPFLKAALWAFVFSSFIPFLWFPLLEGYPDNGGAALLVFGFVLLLAFPRKVAFALSAGFLLGMAVVFRRHFAYPVLALLLTSATFDFFFLLSKGRVWKKALPSAIFYGVLAAATAGTVFFIEPAYFKEILQTDFQALYRSYDQGGVFFSRVLLGRMGYFLLGLSLAGYASAAWQFPAYRKSLAFVFCFFLVWFVLWGWGSGQTGDHYLIAVPPLFCLVGLACFFHVLRPRFLALPFLFFLAANSLHAFWLAPKTFLPNEVSVTSLESAPRVPWVREDYDELTRLARYLQDRTSDKTKIALVGSSFVFNQDLMRSVFLNALNRRAPLDRFLFVSEVDNVQQTPLDVLASAHVFVVPDPPQYHLPPEGQKVLTSLSSLFPPKDAWLPFFEKDLESFDLAGRVKIAIWRRGKDWSPLALHEALSAMRRVAPTEQLWVLEKGRGVVSAPNPSDGLSRGHFVFTPRFSSSLRLFLDKPLREGSYRLRLSSLAQESCGDFDLRLRVLDRDGGIVFSHTGRPVQNPGMFFSPFVLRASEVGPFFASLEITARPSEPCALILQQLGVEEILSDSVRAVP